MNAYLIATFGEFPEVEAKAIGDMADQEEVKKQNRSPFMNSYD